MSPTEPYVAVIFTNRHSGADADGYAAMARRMEDLAADQPGYLGIETARGDDGLGITVSYWTSDDAARAWKQESEHLLAQSAGRDRWYDWYHLRVATVHREYEWSRPDTLVHLALPDEWAEAAATGEYAMSTRGVTLAQEGFIHCSFDHQVDMVANNFYADVDHLVVLRVDPTRLDAEVVVEPPAPGVSHHFPHVYGPIPVAAVVSTTDWRRTGDAWHFADLAASDRG